MHKILLEGLEFFANHGYYEKERKLGNKFEINIMLLVDFSKAAYTDDIEGTVNYEEVYAIVKQEMATPSKLLEHVGQRIITRILEEHASVLEIELHIKKFNPPLGGICKSSAIVIHEKRE